MTIRDGSYASPDPVVDDSPGRGLPTCVDDDFDPVEFIRTRRTQDEAWAVLAPKVERLKDQAASPLALHDPGYGNSRHVPVLTSVLRVALGSHVRISPAARAAFGLKP